MGTGNQWDCGRSVKISCDAYSYQLYRTNRRCMHLVNHVLLQQGSSVESRKNTRVMRAYLVDRPSCELLMQWLPSTIEKWRLASRRERAILPVAPTCHLFNARLQHYT